MSKQLAIVGEVQQLGSAMQSHSLSSASSRYGMLRRTRAEHERLEMLLKQRANDDRLALQRYADVVQQITSADSAWLLTARRAADADTPTLVAVDDVVGGKAVPFSEYECVRKLLEQSAQSMMYTQSEQLRIELDAAYAQQTAEVRECVDMLAAYADIVRLHPIEQMLGSHRQHYYADWCAQLLARPTAETCREIGAQVRARFGADGGAMTLGIGHAANLAAQLHAALCEDAGQLQALRDRLQADTDISEDPTSLTGRVMRATMERLLSEQLQREPLLQYTVGLQALSGFNGRLLMLETAAVTAGDGLVDMRTSEGQWFLDELSCMATVGARMVELLVPAASDARIEVAASRAVDTAAKRCVDATGRAYEALRALQHGFVGELLTETLEGICAENAAVLAVIARTSSLQEGIAPIEELLDVLQRQLRRQSGADGPELVRVGDMTDADCVDDVRVLKRRLDSFAQSMHAEHETNVGCRLFVRYWVLFGDVEAKQIELEATIDEIDVPVEWRNFDQLREAGKMAVCIIVWARINWLSLEFVIFRDFE